MSWFFFFSSRRRHTRCALVTGVQTCALPISNVTNPAKELEARVRAKDPSKHIGHDGNPVLTWMVSNAVVTRHVNGTIIPKKESPESPNKIDGVEIGRASCRERVCQYV